MGSPVWLLPGVAVELLGLGGTVGTCGSPGWEFGVPLPVLGACGISKYLPAILGGLLGIYS